LDDISIPRKLVEENLDIVQEVIRRVDEHGLTLFLLLKEIEYLGHIISAGGVKPSRRKMAAVSEFI